MVKVYLVYKIFVNNHYQLEIFIYSVSILKRKMNIVIIFNIDKNVSFFLQKEKTLKKEI